MPESGDVIKAPSPVRFVPVLMDNDRMSYLDPPELISHTEGNPRLFLMLESAAAFRVSPAGIYVVIKSLEPPVDRKTIFHVPSPSAVLCL